MRGLRYFPCVHLQLLLLVSKGHSQQLTKHSLNPPSAGDLYFAFNAHHCEVRALFSPPPADNTRCHTLIEPPQAPATSTSHSTRTTSKCARRCRARPPATSGPEWLTPTWRPPRTSRPAATRGWSLSMASRRLPRSCCWQSRCERRRAPASSRPGAAGCIPARRLIRHGCCRCC